MPNGLPLEVWEKVLLHLVSWRSNGAPKYGEYVANFFPVCRWWKELAERVLYRDMHICTLKQPESLALRTITSTSSRPGPWIRSLTIHCYIGESEFWEDMTIILLTASNLVALRSRNVNVPASVLATISTVASSSISHLSVRFDGRSVAAMHMISSFPALKDLRVTFDDDTQPDFARIDPWIIPTIHIFSWRYGTECEDVCPGDDSLRFLAACRFASRCRIELVFSDLWPNQSVLLNPFFSAHHDAEMVSMCSWMSISESSTIFTAQNVEFVDRPPPAMLFTRRSLPRRVSICVDLDEDEHPIWDILDVLESRKKLEHPLVLRVALRTILIFSWRRDAIGSELSNEYTSFIGRLLPRALRLYSQGVIIVDEEGESVHAQIQEGGENSLLHAT